DHRLEYAPSFGRERRVGDGRMVEEDQQVRGQYAAVEEVFEQAFVTRSEQDQVVRNARPRTLDREMHDEQRRAETLPVETTRELGPAWRGAQQVAIGVDQVGVAGDRIERSAPAAQRFDLGRLRADGMDRGNRV